MTADYQSKSEATTFGEPEGGDTVRDRARHRSHYILWQTKPTNRTCGERCAFTSHPLLLRFEVLPSRCL